MNKRERCINSETWVSKQQAPATIYKCAGIRNPRGLPSHLRISENSLEAVQELLALRTRRSLDDAIHIEDLVFVAIDFEKIRDFRDLSELAPDGQVGIAILDARDVGKRLPDEAISTFHFVFGSHDYCADFSKEYLFGSSRIIQRHELLSSITSLIPSSRPVVLVGHSVSAELEILISLDFNFDCVTMILDTFLMTRLARTLYNRLGDVLDELGLPVGNLHCAGNDAHLTLRLLLLLAIRSCDESFNTLRLTTLRAIADLRIPCPDNFNRWIPKQTSKERARIRRDIWMQERQVAWKNFRENRRLQRKQERQDQLDQMNRDPAARAEIQRSRNLKKRMCMENLLTCDANELELNGTEGVDVLGENIVHWPLPSETHTGIEELFSSQLANWL